MLVYRGPSEFGRGNINGIITPRSSNPKTEDIPQLWILPDAVPPHKAVKTGEDFSVCGDCKHRPENMDTCYVRTYQAPRAVSAALEKGSYDSEGHIVKTLEILKKSKLRLGAWGDPAALPRENLDELLSLVDSWLGYTHQWRWAELQDICMASVDSIKEYEEARAIGYRCFLVLEENAEPPPGAIECPADSRGITCKQCGLCDGKDGPGDKRKDIFIRVHGVKKGKFKVIQ